MNREEMMRRLAELRAILVPLNERSKAGSFTDADQTAWDAAIAEVDDLRNKINALDARAAAMSGIEPLLASTAVSDGQRAAGSIGAGATGVQQGQGGGSGARAIDRRSLGRIITESPEFRAWTAGGENGSVSVDLDRGFYFDGDPDAPSAVRAGSRMWERETRGLVYTGSFPTAAVEVDRVPGILQQQFLRPTVRDAFTSSPTTSNLITFVRELLLSHTNAAVGVIEPTASGGSTGTKPESTLVFDGDEAPVREIATWIPIAENIADDLPGLESLINNRLLDFLAQAEDDDLLNGDGVSPNLKGLLNTSGTQVADDTYFGANPVQDAGSSNEDYNRILAASSLVTQVGLGTASFVMMTPTAFQYMLTVTDDNRNYLGGGPFVTGAIPRIWGLPIIQTDKLDDDMAIVGDGRMAEVRDRQQGTIDVGYINDQFVRDMKTIRAKERVAFPVYRPAAFVLTSLALN